MLSNISFDNISIGAPVIVLFIFCTLFCQIVTRNFLGKEAIKNCHDVSGHYLAIVGTFTAVLLGLVLVDAMTKFQAVFFFKEKTAYDISNIYSAAINFPKYTDVIRKLSTEYIDKVIEEEIPLMEDRQWSEEARNIAYSLTLVIQNITPENDNQRAIYPYLIQEIGSLWEDRKDRTTVSNYSIPEAEWVVLILASGITIFFTFFFTVDSVQLHLFMTGLVSFIIIASLYLIFLFGTPFSGTLKVSFSKFYLAQQYTHEGLPKRK